MTVIFRHTLDVRFRDCDPMGHVNNAVYLTYLEQARFAHWREVWGVNFERLPENTPGVILARAEIDYRRPAKYGDVLEIRIGLEKIGRTSFTYLYEVVDQAGAGIFYDPADPFAGTNKRRNIRIGLQPHAKLSHNVDYTYVRFDRDTGQIRRAANLPLLDEP